MDQQVNKTLFSDFDWSVANDFIVSASLDGTSRLWNPTSGQCLRVFNDNWLCPVLSCRFQPLNNNMIVVSFSMSFCTCMSCCFKTLISDSLKYKICLCSLYQLLSSAQNFTPVLVIIKSEMSLTPAQTGNQKSHIQVYNTSTGKCIKVITPIHSLMSPCF